MARKRTLALTLLLAAVAPAALAGCGGSPATPTVAVSTPTTAALPTRAVTTVPRGEVPTPIPTAPGQAPLPQGTGMPAAVPSVQP